VVNIRWAATQHVAELFVINLPPKVKHGIVAGSNDARIVTVQDARFAFAG